MEEGGEGGVVTDEDESGLGAGAFFEEQFDESFAVAGIESGSRFVGEDDFGSANEGAGGGDALLLPDAEFGDGAIQEVGHAEMVEEPGGFCCRVTHACPPIWRKA